jgi:DNA-damage-inducible protein D
MFSNKMGDLNKKLERGVRPEALPPADDVKKVQRKLSSDAKKLIKTAKKRK